MDYPRESWTEGERATLAPHFTNLDGPVFALVNLPETVKGALFARYSRYPGTLRRLFLDEFAEGLGAGGSGGADVAGEGDGGAGEAGGGGPGAASANAFDQAEGERAAELYRKIFLGYGDDSVAQLGGVHLACEWVSNVMTKVLQRGRLAAYLEQSTRYIAYDSPMPGAGSQADGSSGTAAGSGAAAGPSADGGYRYWRDPSLGPEYARAMDGLFETYAQAIPAVERWAAERFPPADGQPEAAHRRSIRAKALDLLRGLLPAASLSHMGIFATGQAYEQLVMRLLASPLPEARELGGMVLAELQKVIPSFVTRVERPERGGRWIGYLQQRRDTAERAAARLGLDVRSERQGTAPAVRLLASHGTEVDLIAALLFESSSSSEKELRAAVEALGPVERAALIAELAGERENRRHRPGRGFEAIRYRFEVVSDYGAFRDLQRHRMLTIQWQPLTPDLGAGIPEELRAAGVADDYERALELSRAEFERLCEAGRPEVAPYALCLGYRIRYVLDMNAREAMHLIELRSGREGHPGYRAVAHELHAQIATIHPAVAEAMSHVDRDAEPRLERILGEIRAHARGGEVIDRLVAERRL